MKSSIKNQLNSPAGMKTTATVRTKNVDMIIALAVFLSCCLISFTETKEVVEVLFSTVRP